MGISAGSADRKRSSLTDIAIRNLKPTEGRREVPDPAARGLYVVVQPTGVKTFAVRYRFNGKPQKFTLGRWQSPADANEVKSSKEPRFGDAISLAAARKLAADVLLQVGRGRDPAAAKRQDKEEQQQASANTFRVVADEYFKRQCGMRIDAHGNVTFNHEKMRSGPNLYATISRLVFPTLGPRPIGEIKKSDVVRLLDKIEDGDLKDENRKGIKGGRVMADRTLALIRAIMNWYAAREDDFRSPIVRGMARTKPKERARKRVLADDEIRDIWAALDYADVPECYPSYVKALLLTATRRTEAADMKSIEIEGDLWTIPGERYKTKLDHVVPLTLAAKALVGSEPDGHQGNSLFVFSTTGGTKAFSGFSKAKKALDIEIAKRRKAQERPAMPRWTLHDLRRTARSLMSRAKVPADHAERALGHVIGGIRETYDRHEYLDEKRNAFTALAATVEAILSPPADNVVRFPPRTADENNSRCD